MKTSMTFLAATLLCCSCTAMQPRWHQTDGSLSQTTYYVDINERANFRITCANRHIKMTFTDRYGDVPLTALIIDGQRFEDDTLFNIHFNYEDDVDQFRPLWNKLRSAKRITAIADTTPPKSFELPTSTVAKVLPADFTQCDGQQT